jgi:hypothetical protein
MIRFFMPEVEDGLRELLISAWPADIFLVNSAEHHPGIPAS